jgi:surface polysaccharide O-acyltransferase-like enzyme
MTVVARNLASPVQQRDVSAAATSRSIGVDTMRGIAILMVIGIHSLQQPLDKSWEVIVDSALRPCVPIFLFASGYLTALSGRIPLGKRIKAALIPYTIAFAVAYLYMALHNPDMDHRATVTIARYVLAYVFVYYYVFTYIGCTIALWLVFAASRMGTPGASHRLVFLLLLSIVLGLIVGSYLDPLLLRHGFSESLVQEVRLRDIPFWFCFAALGALVGIAGRTSISRLRAIVLSAVLFTYAVYAGARIFGIGDDAAYDSTAFFGYAALFSILLFLLDWQIPFLASVGSGSYFIYLWHIFVVLIIRDHTLVREYGDVAGFVVTYLTATAVSLAALWAIRSTAPSRLTKWLGA